MIPDTGWAVALHPVQPFVIRYTLHTPNDSPVRATNESQSSFLVGTKLPVLAVGGDTRENSSRVFIGRVDRFAESKRILNPHGPGRLPLNSSF